MFAQVFPLFQETFKNGQQWFPWATLPVLYPNGVDTIKALYDAGGQAAVDGIVGTTVDPSVPSPSSSMRSPSATSSTRPRSATSTRTRKTSSWPRSTTRTPWPAPT